MKAKDFLYWCLDFQICSESGVDRVTIEDDLFFTKEEFIERFFGAKLLKDIPCGEYVYIWSDVIDNKTDSCKEFILKNYETRLIKDEYYIYLIRIED